MIWFDNKKQAYAYEIPNYIATVEDNIWAEYAGTDKWDIIDGVFTDITDTPEYKAKLLKQAKEAKIEENDIKRDNALIRGVEYKEVLFDSDTDQKVNLLGKISEMGDEDVITWFGMDNVPLECTKQDLACIGGLIIQLHTFCWNHNAEIKNKIAKAKTVKQVEAIEINYEGVN